MMPSPTRTTTLIPQLIFALGIALAALAAGPAIVGAQGPTEHWRLAETWRDQPASTAVTALDWPAGHLPGGLGADWVGGQVFACDLSSGHIRIYDWRGAFVGLLEGADGQPLVFNEPRDVATYYTDADDPATRHVMVSEGGANRVRIFDASGKLAEAYPVVDPVGLLVSDGERLVVSRSRKLMVLLGRTAPDGANLVIRLPGSVSPERVEADYRSGDDVSLLVADPGLDGPLAVRQRGIEPWRFGRAAPLRGLRGLMAVPAVDPRGELRQYVLAAGPDGLVQVDDDARPNAVIPFDRVHDVALYYEGANDRIFATVEPHGLVLLGELDDVLRYTARSLQTFTSLRRVAVDGLVVLGEDSPRLQVLRRSGDVLGRAQLSVWPAPRLPVRDVAATGDSLFLLTGTYGGSLTHLIRNATDTGIALGASNWSATQTRILTAADADERERVALLDSLNQEAVLLDPAQATERTVSLSTPKFRGILDLAFGAGRIFLADQQRSAIESWTDAGLHLWTRDIEGGVQSVTAGFAGDAFALSASGWISHLGADGAILGEWPAGTPAERPSDLAHGPDGRIYVTDNIEDLRIYAQDPGAPRPGAKVTGASPCVLRGDKASAPPEIQLGETVEVSLAVDGRCPVERVPADVVLVIDRSGSMTGEKIIAARDAAFTFAARTDPELVRIAVVPFGSTVQLAHPLQDPDRTAIAQSLGALQSGGGTHIAAALDRAVQELILARADAKRVIVLLSDGQHNGPGNPRAVAATARSNGIEIYTIGLGGDADVASLETIAGDESRHRFAPSAFDLLEIYSEIARRVEADVLFRQATLVDHVPDNMTYIIDSAQPSQPAWDPAARTLTWTYADLPEPGFRLSYRLRPQETGTHPTNVSAEVDFTDGFGHTGQVVMPVPQVHVLGLGAPTATPWTPPPTRPAGTPTTGPLETPTSIPERTPTSMSTPTPPGPTSTPGPLTNRIYLPVQLRESCTEMRRLVDVVLVLDASTSMRDTRNAAGMSRLEAAYMAADRFVQHLVMPGDRAAVVSFNDRAELLQELTGERIYVRAGLLRITPRMQTRLDLGIAAARDELAANGRPHVERAIVVLTDGLANPVPMDVAVSEADAARALGITIHAVGLGDTIDEPGLRRVAGHPSRYHHATDNDDLAELYERIASRLPCPNRWFWGGRP